MTLGLGEPSVSFQLKKTPKPKSPNLSTFNIFQNISPQNVIRKKKLNNFMMIRRDKVCIYVIYLYKILQKYSPAFKCNRTLAGTKKFLKNKPYKNWLTKSFKVFPKMLHPTQTKIFILQIKTDSLFKITTSPLLIKRIVKKMIQHLCQLVYTPKITGGKLI